MLPSVISGKWGYHRQGSCQAGLGAAVAKVRHVGLSLISKYTIYINTFLIIIISQLSI